MRRLLVAPDRLPEAGGLLALTSTESRYLQRVLRLPSGSPVEVRDGHGHRWSAKLQPDGRLHLSPREPLIEPPGPQITLAFAPAKGKRLETLLEKAAELGAHHLQPIVTARTVRQPGAHATDRWQRIADAAARQSAAPRAPEVGAPIPWPTALATLEADLRLLPHPEAPAPLRDALPEEAPASVVVFTGPEGGFTPTELDEAEAAGVLPVQLGPRILRAETAPLVVLTLLQHRYATLG